jgi:uncharacterized surface protein with fasciclin (FAS1) repeats
VADAKAGSLKVYLVLASSPSLSNAQLAATFGAATFPGTANQEAFADAMRAAAPALKSAAFWNGSEFVAVSESAPASPHSLTAYLVAQDAAGNTTSSCAGPQTVADRTAPTTPAFSRSSIATRVNEAGLIETLKGAGPFTVFAPTDEAFAKLPPGTVETLLKPENKDKLKEILLLHVVPGQVYAADVVKLKEAKTAGGKTVSISTEGGVTVGTATGKANVVKTDIKAGNGVIHVIDAVIVPE